MPGVHALEGVVLTPAVRDPGLPAKLALGAHDAAGRFLDAFALVRAVGASGRLPAPASAPDRVPAAIYGGVLFDQYGHFLLESLARCWAIRGLDPGLPIAWHSTQRHLADWQREVFALLGIATRRFIEVDRPLGFDRILVPEPGFRIKLLADAGHFAALCAVPAVPVLPGKRVWLSRSSLPASKIRITGEQILERELTAQGWTILHPQGLSVAAQIHAMANAETIAGIEGSAFHTVVLFDCRSRVVIFQRGPKANANYALIAEAKGMRQEVLDVGLRPDVADRKALPMDENIRAAILRALAARAGP